MTYPTSEVAREGTRAFTHVSSPFTHTFASAHVLATPKNARPPLRSVALSRKSYLRSCELTSSRSSTVGVTAFYGTRHGFKLSGGPYLVGVRPPPAGSYQCLQMDVMDVGMDATSILFPILCERGHQLSRYE